MVCSQDFNNEETAEAAPCLDDSFYDNLEDLVACSKLNHNEFSFNNANGQEFDYAQTSVTSQSFNELFFELDDLNFPLENPGEVKGCENIKGGVSGLGQSSPLVREGSKEFQNHDLLDTFQLVLFLNLLLSFIVWLFLFHYW